MCPIECAAPLVVCILCCFVFLVLIECGYSRLNISLGGVPTATATSMQQDAKI
jgi:hypothetical protein